MREVTETEGGRWPKVVRRSPLAPRRKLCPRCLSPLNGDSKLGGWLIPQDYFCTSCGYKGTVFLEASGEEGKEKETKA